MWGGCDRAQISGYFHMGCPQIPRKLAFHSKAKVVGVWMLGAYFLSDSENCTITIQTDRRPSNLAGPPPYADIDPG